MLISVLLPVYNESVINLTKAITSIISQTHTGKIEIIAVDDGSDADHNTEWLERQFGKHPISHVEFKRFYKENGGTASALNRAIKESKGEILAWLSSDDLWHPNKLLVQMDRFYKVNWDWCFSGFEQITKNRIDIFVDEYFIQHGITDVSKINLAIRRRHRYDSWGSGFINGVSCMWKRKLHDEVGLFDEKLQRAQDMDMWIRFAYKNYKVDLIGNPLVIKRAGKPSGEDMMKRGQDIAVIQGKIKNYLKGIWDVESKK